MQIDDEKFNQRRTEAETHYKSIGGVKCPYFNGESIHFNSEGFEHLLLRSGIRRVPGLNSTPD